MKTFISTLVVFIVLTACQNTAKDPDVKVANEASVSQDEITKSLITDSYGYEMEIIRNHSKNTVTIHLDGKTYQLKKNESTPGYSTEDNKYLYTDTKNEVIFTKKDVEMVLFRGKKSQEPVRVHSK
ncbi:hypothetical protein [Chryseobacterium sp.]|uniref:hypothetical protein n=1 Tax=Chryseobacterium sp. TaxID=1871047 RepID=UPI0038903CBD